MKIGLLGDVHANRSAIRVMLNVMERVGVENIIQVGDFGIYRSQGVLEYLKLSNLIASQSSLKLYITPGNHEDWTWINELHAEEKRHTEEGWTMLRSNIFLAPRGLRWEWDGVRFLSLGGAPSVDRGWRVREDARHPNAKNPLWDAGEAITLEDAQKAMDGGHVEVMIAHDAPYGVPTIEHKIAGNPLGFDGADLLYARDGRDLMKQVVDSVAPDTFIHGHYHFQVNDQLRAHNDKGWTHYMGLDCELNRWSMGIYDTETQKAEFLNWRAYLAQNV